MTERKETLTDGGPRARIRIETEDGGTKVSFSELGDGDHRFIVERINGTWRAMKTKFSN